MVRAKVLSAENSPQWLSLIASAVDSVAAFCRARNWPSSARSTALAAAALAGRSAGHVLTDDTTGQRARLEGGMAKGKSTAGCAGEILGPRQQV